MAPCRPDHASLAERPVRRQDPRQEPSAVVPLAGICAGGRPQGRSLPRILDADIRGFYDAIDHGWLGRFVGHRIADKRVLRLIQKWLERGEVAEDGAWSASEEGAPQGASASPLLANVYLHYVFDLWARHWRNRKPTVT